MQVGDFAEAEKHLSLATELAPGDARTFLQLSQLKSFTFDDPSFLRMQEIYEDESISPLDRCYINFALAKVFHGQKKFRLAFDRYVEGNRVRKQLLDYDITEDMKLFSDLKSSYLFLKQCSVGEPRDDKTITPIFIVGMPRSGSTLVEQILSSNSQVAVGGELPLMERFGSSLATGTNAASASALAYFRNQYLGALKSYQTGAI